MNLVSTIWDSTHCSVQVTQLANIPRPSPTYVYSFCLQVWIQVYHLCGLSVKCGAWPLLGEKLNATVISANYFPSSGLMFKELQF